MFHTVVPTQTISTFSYPTRVHFGPKSLTKLADFLAPFKRPMIVADGGIVAAGLAERVAAALGKEGILFADVAANPVEANVHAGVALYRDSGCDVIVAVGGGSPLDVGKAIRLAITHTRPLIDYDDLTGGDRFITADMPPMVAIPTTAGTGSEVSRSTVVTLDVNNRKTVLFSPYLMPTLAICDPELTVGLPSRLTAATGMDALSHNIEAYCAKGYHPMADAIALAGIRLVGQWLVKAVNDGNDIDARAHMLMASLMGAVAFQKGLGVCHSLAHPLSSVAGVHHGTANAILLPHVLAFNDEAAPGKVCDVALALGTRKDATRSLHDMNIAVGLPAHLAEVGVTPEMIPIMVPKAMEDGCRQGNPRDTNEDDLRRLYEAAM